MFYALRFSRKKYQKLPVLVLDVQHLFVNFLHGHAASENGSDGQISAVARIASGHHVFGVEHLLGQLWDGQRPVNKQEWTSLDKNKQALMKKKRINGYINFNQTEDFISI